MIIAAIALVVTIALLAWTAVFVVTGGTMEL
jgi:hypothetical protein